MHIVLNVIQYTVELTTYFKKNGMMASMIVRMEPVQRVTEELYMIDVGKVVGETSDRKEFPERSPSARLHR